MRNLILISLFAFCLGCSPSPYLHLIKPEGKSPCLRNLKPQFTSELYSAGVNVTGKHLSGLLLFKTMTDSAIRVIFTNETGVTFFDFEFHQNGGFRVVSCIKQINKRLVINRLKNDLGLILMHGLNVDQPEILTSGNETYYSFVLKNEHIYYITDATCSQLNRIETASKKKQKIIVKLSGYTSGMPDSVYLAHQSFEYNITLKKIIR